jgi:hypothetical protein
MTAMGLEKRPKEARELQACATVGQPELMSEYGKHLRRHKLLGSQMLLTYWDLDSRAPDPQRPRDARPPARPQALRPDRQRERRHRRRRDQGRRQ